jgi:flagellar biosynthesis/type III secretory pathway chaperone
LSNQLVEQLIEVLGQEADIYEEILRISKDKTKVIIEGKVTELDNITKVEQSLIFKIRQAEDVRENLVEKLAEELNTNAPDTTISELLKHMKKGQAKKLKSVREKIMSILNELKETNYLNSRLIKNSLQYIDFSINLFSDEDGGSNNYSNSGQVDNSKKRSIMDVKL